MTQPVQEPTQGRVDASQGFASRQLFRRPAPSLTQGSLRQTGWTVLFGDGTTPVVTGDYQAVWKVPRQIVGDQGAAAPGVLWYIYQPSASVVTAPSGSDLEIMLWRVRNDGTTLVGVDALLDDPLVIDDGTFDSNASASPVVVTQFQDLEDWSGTPVGPFYDSIMVEVTVAAGALGLSLNVPIGIEQPAGSGYHIP